MKIIVITLLSINAVCLLTDFVRMATTKEWPIQRDPMTPARLFAEALIELAFVTWCAVVLYLNA